MVQQRSDPQPCGFFNDWQRECHCTPPMIQRYLSRISGPLLDRIDIHIDVPAVNYKELRSPAAPEGSAQIRERVIRAREVQLNRFAAAAERSYCNAQMSTRQIRAHCELSTDCERLLERAMTQQGLSARAHDRIPHRRRPRRRSPDRTQAHYRSDSIPQPGSDVSGMTLERRWPGGEVALSNIRAGKTASPGDRA